MRLRCRTAPFVAATFTACLVGAVYPAAARSQGFGLNEIGSCAIARGFAVTGAPCHDASTLYWNPGAATMLPGWSIYVGGTAIGVNATFTADTSLREYRANVPTTFVPDLFVNYTGSLHGHRIAVGLGAYVPYGLTSQWNPGFPGDFESMKGQLQSIYFQPNIAIEIVPDKLSLGGGPVIGYSTVQLKQSIDLSSQVALPGVTLGDLGIPAGTEFARGELTGSSTALGWTFGVHYKPLPTLQFGARVLSALSFSFKNAKARFTQIPTGLTLAANNPITGTVTPVDTLVAAQFASGGPLSPQGVSSTITDPLQAQAGIGYSPRIGTMLSLDYEFVQWSRFQNLPIIFAGGAASSSHVILEQYHNSSAIRAGIDQLLWPGGATGRVGFSYAESPAPAVSVTPLLPDMNRYNGSLGIGLPLSDVFALDAAYLHVFTNGRRGRTTELAVAQGQSPVALEQLTAAEIDDGFYTLTANVFSISLKMRF